MLTVKGIEDLPPLERDSALAIGNFDGVHLGHQKILELLSDLAQKKDLTPVVLTFFPHPEMVLAAKPLLMLQTLEQRLAEIEKTGIRLTLVLPFTRQLARYKAERFIEDIVVGKLRAKIVVIGRNFRFGRSREGDIGKLQELAARLGFRVRAVNPVCRKNQVVSSSLIRDLLGQGNIESANSLLGRPYEVEGTVIKGKSRGKLLGFPTANIRALNEIAPPGVFISEVIAAAKTWPSVTHVGAKPTFGERERQIESYILGFNDTLYGSRIRVFFLKKIREAKKFETPEALSRQIRKDLRLAKEFFRRRTASYGT